MGFVYAFDITFIFYFGNILWNLSVGSVGLGGCDASMSILSGNLKVYVQFIVQKFDFIVQFIVQFYSKFAK
jgi:hypothetical protein